MRKFGLLLIMSLFTLLAGAKDIKVTEGSTDYLKTGGTIDVNFHWDNATYNFEKSVKEEWGDKYDKYKTEGKEYFIGGFNHGNKVLKMVGDGSNADYTMTVTMTNFDKYFSPMSLVPGNKYKVWAEITVKDNKTGKVVCAYKVTEFSGTTELSVFDSFLRTMRTLGINLGRGK